MDSSYLVNMIEIREGINYRENLNGSQEVYKNASPARLDYLHGEHDLHSPIISLEPFIFINYSLPRVARSLSFIFVTEKKEVSISSQSS